jgi:serine/threonine-protein kinase
MKPTTREDWNEIDRIFAAALLIDPGKRSAFLDQECGANAHLRAEVESLLANDKSGTIGGTRAIAEATTLLGAVLPAQHPEFIGRYAVLAPLGFGGMGRVYLAQDGVLDRKVALKLLAPYNAEEDERIRRFQQEALAASALNHPNILTIYETGEHEGVNFIATEFVDGETLRARLAAGPVPIPQAIEIATQIASAISAAHQAGIIHRDLKPANIMLRGDGLVKILDFGAAKYTPPDTQGRGSQLVVETSPGMVVGTASYMSPEQARGLAVDPRSDMWSLGVVLYEMVTGSALFTGATAMDVLAAVIGSRLPDLSDIPDELQHIILRALEREAAARYQNALEMHSELRALAKRLEFADFEQGSKRSTAIKTGPRLSSGKRTVAVLPFVNMSNDPDNEYFCDGLSEELINALTRVQELQVAARTSAFSFKGKETTISGIARVLGVISVLEGSVRRPAIGCVFRCNW